jgi:hypothetical protein
MDYCGWPQPQRLSSSSFTLTLRARSGSPYIVQVTIMRTGIPLPKTDSLQVQQMANEDPSYLTAYNLCLQCEDQFVADENKLCCIRLLGYLLLSAPNQSICSELTRCIQSCQNDNNLSDLGSFFRLYFVSPCGFSGYHSCPRMPIYPPSFSVRKFKGRTPRPSSHPSRPSFDAVKSQIKVDIQEAPRDHEDAKIRVSGWSPLFLVPLSHRSHRLSCETTGDVSSQASLTGTPPTISRPDLTSKNKPWHSQSARI